MIPPKPSRAEVWLIDFSPTRGHEPTGLRPGLVISVDEFNHGLSGLVIVLPATTRPKGIPLHVEVKPPEAGVRVRSFIKCEDIRSISLERLIERWGMVTPLTMQRIDQRLRMLLAL